MQKVKFTHCYGEDGKHWLEGEIHGRVVKGAPTGFKEVAMLHIGKKVYLCPTDYWVGANPFCRGNFIFELKGVGIVPVKVED